MNAVYSNRTSVTRNLEWVIMYTEFNEIRLCEITTVEMRARWVSSERKRKGEGQLVVAGRGATEVQNSVHLASITNDVDDPVVALQLAPAVLARAVRRVVMSSSTTQVFATAGPRCVEAAHSPASARPALPATAVLQTVVGRLSRKDHQLLAHISLSLSLSFSICGAG